MSQSTYHLRNIRKLLTTAFSDEEFRQLCFEVPSFRPVYEQFSTGMSKSQMMHRLIEYCDRKGLMEKLLAAIRDEVPDEYARFADKLRDQGGSASATTDDSGAATEIDEVSHVRELISQKTRNLHTLQQQVAQYGIAKPLELVNQIEDLETEIAALKEKLKS